jgi:putative tryptophan/tyrosine transport system substrate-binding protein
MIKIRKYFIFGCIIFVLITLVFSFTVGCTKPKVYKVGVLIGLEFLTPIYDALKEKMTKLGYIDDQNISYDLQVTNFDMDKYKSVIQKFVTDKVDVIFVAPTEPALIAKQIAAKSGIPIVFNYSFIEGLDLIDSIQKPGENITGVRYPGPDIAVKIFEVMNQLIPEAKRYLIPYLRGYPSVSSQLEALRPVVAKAGVKIIELPVANAAEIEEFFKEKEKNKDFGFDVISVLAEPLIVTAEPFTALTKFAYKHNIPFGGSPFIVGEYATMFGINADPFKSGEMGATILDKVLKGTPAGNIPVYSSDSYLMFNIKVAQRFGITIPDSLLNQALQIIK